MCVCACVCVLFPFLFPHKTLNFFSFCESFSRTRA
uniref:Uncharacterized protein n=1 Tax=Rhizophora mucronata TaxID=61149 RepID=A0A2P2M227_RHIMU